MGNLVGYEKVANEQAQGYYGFNEINSTGGLIPILASDRYMYLEAEGDTVFSFDNETAFGVGSVSTATVTLLDGKFRFGYFKNIVVTSGKLVAYYAKH